MGSTHHLPMNVLPLLTENEESSSFFLRLSSSISSLGILSKPSSQNATPSFVALCVHWTSQHPRLLLFASLSVQGVCVLLKARDRVLLKFTFPGPAEWLCFYIWGTGSYTSTSEASVGFVKTETTWPHLQKIWGGGKAGVAELGFQL